MLLALGPISRGCVFAWLIPCQHNDKAGDVRGAATDLRREAPARAGFLHPARSSLRVGRKPLAPDPGSYLAAEGGGGGWGAEAEFGRRVSV